MPPRNFCHPDPEYLDYDNTNFSNLFASDDMDNSSRMRNQFRVDYPLTKSAQISERPGTIDNLPPLNGLYIGLLVVMAIHAILFYIQLWKPMTVQEKTGNRTEEFSD